MENILVMKRIQDLLGMEFYIPSYQRGYRWESRQVLDLLEDLHDFNQKFTDSKYTYCLQPVVVVWNPEVVKWEVIDGQQRLTTLYLILKYLDSSLSKFSIEYATRSKSQYFLENVNKLDDTNVDFYYISKAYTTIDSWFTNIIQKDPQFKYTCLGLILGRLEVLWYEVQKESTPNNTEIFTRLNMGKIALTNSELIKAILLTRPQKQDSNANSFNEQLFFQKQLEKSQQWDNIESTFQNEDFWAFLNSKSKKKRFPMTRIEFIFECIVKQETKINLTDDEDAIFRYFYDKVNRALKDHSGVEQVIDLQDSIWDKVKHNFFTFREWYYDRYLYHLIGYLIFFENTDVSKLITEFHQTSKKEFRKKLRERIKKTLPKIDLDTLENLEYEKNYKDIFKILILFNIITIMKSESSTERISFAAFRDNVWSLEHIHAQNSENLSSTAQYDEWMNEHKKALQRIDDEFMKTSDYSQHPDIYLKQIEKIDRFLKLKDSAKSRDTFLMLSNDIFQIFMENEDPNYTVHSLSNLVLLDSKSNSSLSNSVFDVKRNLIVKKDKEGKYILPATRNAFLKYYSESIEQLHFWGPQDRSDYCKSIHHTLNSFLE